MKYKKCNLHTICLDCMSLGMSERPLQKIIALRPLQTTQCFNCSAAARARIICYSFVWPVGERNQEIKSGTLLGDKPWKSGRQKSMKCVHSHRHASIMQSAVLQEAVFLSRVFLLYFLCAFGCVCVFSYFFLLCEFWCINLFLFPRVHPVWSCQSCW